MCDIYPMMRQFALGMLMLTAGANLLAQGAEINWIKVDELEAAQARESRKVMIDVYTKWCGPCKICLLYTSPSPRDATLSRMPSSA